MPAGPASVVPEIARIGEHMIEIVLVIIAGRKAIWTGCGHRWAMPRSDESQSPLGMKLIAAASWDGPDSSDAA